MVVAKQARFGLSWTGAWQLLAIRPLAPSTADFIAAVESPLPNLAPAAH
jgi:hypothetical protein